MSIIKYGFREHGHTALGTINLEETFSILFNNPKAFIHEYEKGTKFSYITDVKGNPIDKEAVYKIIKKATTQIV